MNYAEYNARGPASTNDWQRSPSTFNDNINISNKALEIEFWTSFGGIKFYWDTKFVQHT